MGEQHTCVVQRAAISPVKKSYICWISNSLRIRHIKFSMNLPNFNSIHFENQSPCGPNKNQTIFESVGIHYAVKTTLKEKLCGQHNTSNINRFISESFHDLRIQCRITLNVTIQCFTKILSL